MIRLAPLTSALALAALIGISGIAIPSLAQTPPATANNIAAFTDPQNVAKDLQRLDMALNNTGTLSGQFNQLGSDGSNANGTLYLQRPGKIRFEYNAPNPLLIVSDGVTIQQSDLALGTSDRIPLSSTPLDFFLKQTVSLARDTDVLALRKFTGETHVTVRDKTGEAAGEMTLIFNEPNLALKEWQIRDEFGTLTRVQLTDLTYNQNLDPRLFVLGNGRGNSDSRRRR